MINGLAPTNPDNPSIQNSLTKSLFSGFLEVVGVRGRPLLPITGEFCKTTNESPFLPKSSKISRVSLGIIPRSISEACS